MSGLGTDNNQTLIKLGVFQTFIFDFKNLFLSPPIFIGNNLFSAMVLCMQKRENSPYICKYVVGRHIFMYVQKDNYSKLAAGWQASSQSGFDYSKLLGFCPGDLPFHLL